MAYGPYSQALSIRTAGPYFLRKRKKEKIKKTKKLEICDRYFLLPYALYTEVRKSRRNEEIGEPLKIQTSGDVHTAYKGKYVKIFVKVG